MKKIILNWLFGTDDIEQYIDLLRNCKEYCNRLLSELNKHHETLQKHKEDLEIIRKLIRICENHGIDVDEEIKEEVIK